ncbi:DUF3618 domain-containing protein [Streptomyces sp. NBC_00704]|uniref:DUF3618 domain-containing protein n=1 Tax=Streptomyces sp. NBC_00704 TaxID=2975809 RepID=UPI002E3336AD|nr:DUF3618 domain-containing protein [Streptomyces sp. NBC_00704]
MTDKAAADLRRQIEQTRHQLGETVEELAAKADVRGRARARAADLRDRAGAMSVQLRSSAAEAGRHMHDRANRAGHAVQERAGRAGHATQERAGRAGHAVQETAARAGHSVQERAVRTRHDLHDKGSGAARTGDGSAPGVLRAPVDFVRRHPWPTAIAGAAVVAAVLAATQGTGKAPGGSRARRRGC